MSYQLRFPCEDEKIFMMNVIKLYVDDMNLRKKNIKVYFNNREKTKFNDIEFYTELLYKYTINCYMDIKDGEVIEYNTPVSLILTKKQVKEFMINNNIVKPKFDKAKLVK